MNKTLKIGCIVIAVLSTLIIGLCGCFAGYFGYSYMANNYKITEKMIGGKVPDGYWPVFAMKAPADKQMNGPGCFAFLTKDSHMVVLVEGPSIGGESAKNNFIQAFEKGMQKKDHSISSGSARVIPDGKISINGKLLPKYKVEMNSKTGTLTGLATFLDYEDKTLLFVCIAQEAIYNPKIAEAFLSGVKLP